MNLKSMFQNFSNNWLNENIMFFGVTARDWFNISISESNRLLSEDAKNNWNNPQCEMVKLVLDGTVCRDSDKIVENSFKLKRNYINDCIDIYCSMKISDSRVEEKLLMSIPSPDTDLNWIINKIKYTPRINASRDYFTIERNGNIIKQGKNWTYDLDLNKFQKSKESIDPFKTLNEKSIALLLAVSGVNEVTEENFESLLEFVPEFDKSSVYNYSFNHIDLFFDQLRTGKNFASPLKNIPLAVNVIFMRQQSQDSVSNKLTASKSPIFSLENYRTVVYKSPTYNSSFSFTDAVQYFDAFKTTTSEDAGRHRLLLDNVFVKDGMLWVMDGDSAKNMYEVFAMKKQVKTGISAISSSQFCCNNDSKRIMMTAKLSAQSVETVGQTDSFTNRTPARVVFADYEGWSYADSIIVSESFAEKLRTVTKSFAIISTKDSIFDSIIEKIDSQNMNLSLGEMIYMFPTINQFVLKNYENSFIADYEYIENNSKIKLFIQSEIPFLYGDKLTNLHGSKGVCGKIVPDDQMPRLKNSIGNFEAGPFDVIISGFSAIRRNSMGQIFEAWARASGIEFEPGEDFIKNAVSKYRKEIAEFSSKSIVEFQGVESVKPCGIIDMIRLHHHATTKASLSYIKPNSGKMLKLGEQEKLSLAANGAFGILKELSIRSSHKWSGDPYKLIYDLEKNRKIPKDLYPSSLFLRLVGSMGVDIKILENGKVLENPVKNKRIRIGDDFIVSNERIDLDDIYEEEA